MILLILLIPLFSQAMTLQEGSRTAQLVREKEYWISEKCPAPCVAREIMKKTSQADLKNALTKFPDARVSTATRLCNGLGGMSWSLKNPEGQTHSICEFKDGSYVLTDDLAGLIKKY